MPDNRTKSFRSGAFGLSSLLLSVSLLGCAAPGGAGFVSMNEPTYMRLTEERAFAQALRQQYLALATNAYDRGDAKRSDFYTLRALMAVEGKLVAPHQLRQERHLRGPFEQEVRDIRLRLNRALDSGVRMGAPDLAARAQAAFDCWMTESRADGDPGIAHACRYNAYQSLAQLEGAARGARAQAAGADPAQIAKLGSAAAGATPASRTIVLDGATPRQTVEVGGVMIEIEQHGGAAVVASTAPSAPGPQAGFVEMVEASQGERVLRHAPPQAAPTPQRTPQFMPQPMPQPMGASEPAPRAASGPYQHIGAIDGVGPAAAQRAHAPQAPSPSDFAQRPAALPPIDLGPITFVEDAPAPSAGPAPRYDPPQPQPQPQAQPQPEPLRQRPAAPAPRYEPQPAPGPRYDPQPQPAPVYRTEAPSAPSAQVDVSRVEVGDGDPAEALLAASENLSRDFAVYFGFDSDDITPEAEDVLVDAVERIALSGARRVTLVGYTDSMGDARYNQLLAMRRAQAVRRYLQNATRVRLDFDIMPVGEIAAVKAGGDGVGDALLRRVEISIQ